MALPPAFLDRLREQTRLSDIASRWVTWDERKSNADKGDLWAPCPFHSEKSASFHVDDHKGFYYCFGCHAKGDVISLMMEKRDIGFMQAVRYLAFLNGMDAELVPDTKNLDQEPYSLLQIKDLVVENFEHENFLEVGIITGWAPKIRSHPRLLRSLSFGDPDFSACVLDLLSEMYEAKDGSIEKVQSYILSKFGSEARAVAEVSSFSSANRSLGYNFARSRNDIIGVMMPFSGGFNDVYKVIKEACDSTPLPARRADDVWNHSVLMNDILELINHSAAVICDLTGKNENVFYELGVAHAWGKTVIPITQNPDHVPFDLKHHRYLHYLNNTEGHVILKRDLSLRLQSLVGKKLRQN